MGAALEGQVGCCDQAVGKVWRCPVRRQEGAHSGAAPAMLLAPPMATQPTPLQAPAPALPVATCEPTCQGRVHASAPRPGSRDRQDRTSSAHFHHQLGFSQIPSLTKACTGCQDHTASRPCCSAVDGASRHILVQTLTHVLAPEIDQCDVRQMASDHDHHPLAGGMRWRRWRGRLHHQPVCAGDQPAARGRHGH